MQQFQKAIIYAKYNKSTRNSRTLPTEENSEDALDSINKRLSQIYDTPRNRNSLTSSSPTGKRGSRGSLNLSARNSINRLSNRFSRVFGNMNEGDYSTSPTTSNSEITLVEQYYLEKRSNEITSFKALQDLIKVHGN
ncbi:ATP-dependent Clp protease proteolytic subunit [Acrasis kona]|uniref:ATP-dependent Clp protease proteolytic subunit n=1 Tax=Acrasis kona TaxID=1008807 RepID=A0AAW2YM17_9EUKA